MTSTTWLDYFLKYLEWILFIILCLLSIFFMYGVLQKFQSKDTSFKQYKENINELPTVTICMARLTFYEYGIDFNISYTSVSDTILKLGENNLSLYEDDILEKVYLEKLQISQDIWSHDSDGNFDLGLSDRTTVDGYCYKVTSKFLEDLQEYILGVGTDFEIVIGVHFNQSIAREDLPSVNIHFTSEKNAYGVIFNEWMDGQGK